MRFRDARSGSDGTALGTSTLRGGFVDSEREIRKGSREDDAIVALGTLDTDVLIEHIIEHGLGFTVERIAPSATATVVIHDPLSGADRHPVGGVLDAIRIVGLVSDDQLVPGTPLAPPDARHPGFPAASVSLHLCCH